MFVGNRLQFEIPEKQEELLKLADFDYIKYTMRVHCALSALHGTDSQHPPYVR